ncbi:MAG: 50S ribosomal protein L25 [bacterium]|nr:50S ribosomal protein L25 [bacterium]
MSYLLSATLRTLKGDKAREDGMLPAVVYGRGLDTKVLSLNLRDFQKMFKEAGEASLIDMTIDGKEAGKVLVQEVQRDPVSDVVVHVDLRQIDMNKSMTARIALNFLGEAPAVKELGGTMVRNISEIEVRCLPKDLVSHIDITLEALKTFEDSIKIKDLKLPAGMEILGHNDTDVVATATPALTEDEIKAMEEASKTADISKIEVSGKKKDEEEGAEVKEGEDAKAPAGKAPAKKEEKK